MTCSEAWNERVLQYEKSHQHPLNRLCHLIGIPLITLSVPMLLAVPFIPDFWVVPLILFITGWIFQFTGHMFEGKPPKFFHDWRYLFVGLHWWIMKITGRHGRL